MIDSIDALGYQVKIMASNDQIIGAIVTVLAIVALGVEFVLLILMPATNADLGGFPPEQYWAITIPLFLGIFGVLGIVAWIGYTMAKTPPPEAWDVEEFESEFEEGIVGDDTEDENDEDSGSEDEDSEEEEEEEEEK